MSRDVLTKAEAEQRSAAISDPRYGVDLILLDAPDAPRATTGIEFTTPDGAPAGLWLDFAGTDVTSFVLDGRPTTPDWDGARLHLPPLEPGRHTAEVVTLLGATAAEQGLVEFIDPVDHRRYLGTAFEPFGAHRVFPCFDQPDLKATINWSVEAPSDWSVISNGPVRGQRPVAHDRRRTWFAPVGPISPYLAAVMAGPFHQVHRQVDTLPVSYAARASRAGALEGDVDDIHAIVEASIRELGHYLGTPMPFAKLDHVFLPGFDEGAMENVGAIAFEEWFLLGPGASASQLAQRAEIVAHEIAHMWFGNLVSINWWDDLWLKESLATYLSFVVLDRASLTAEPWVMFDAGRRAEALDDDRRPSTHPIVGPVTDTDQALIAGDDIAYGKGAAVLHQLAGALGDESLAAGLRSVLNTHEWGTASLSDLVHAVETTSGQDITDWARAWFETSGADALLTTTNPLRGSATVSVVPACGELARTRGRSHSLDITVAWLDEGQLRTERHRRLVTDEATVPLPDVEGPILVLPDGSGRAYARVHLDAGTASAAQQLLGSIADPLLRQLTWSALWELVRLGRLPVARFVDQALHAASGEVSDVIAIALLGRARTALTRWLPPTGRGVRTRAVDVGLTMAARSGHTRSRPWLRLAVDSATSPDDLRRVGEALWGTSRSAASATTAMRWAVVTAAAAHGLPEAELWAATTSDADPDAAADGAAALQAARPDATTKARLWRQIIDGDGTVAEAALKNFFRPEHSALVHPYVDSYFETAETLAPTWPVDRALTFVTAAFPDLPDLGWIPARAERATRSLQGVSPALARPLADAADDLAVACRLRAPTSA